MADEIARLHGEITQLERAINSLANIPDAQQPLQRQLREKQATLAMLRGEQPVAGTAMTSTTNMHGNVTGPVLSDSFASPVNLGGTTVNQGPVINGAIHANRDVNVASEQMIVNRDDSIRVGDITGSTGAAIGRGANVDVRNTDERTGTFVSGDQFNMSGDFRGSILNIKSTLSNVSQSIGAAGNLDQSTADQLKKLVDQLSTELQQHVAQSPEGAEELVKRTEAAVAEATKPKPDSGDVAYSLTRLEKAAATVGKLIPTILPIAGQVVSFIRTMVGA